MFAVTGGHRRVKQCYQQHAARTGVAWRGRQYTPGDFTAGDPVNQAITAAAQCMYGIAHAVVTSLGCSPALGFIHSGHELSFVLDIADLYKIEIGIPVAFDIAAESGDEPGPRTRRALRDHVHRTGLMDRCTNDIRLLLLGENTPTQDPAKALEFADTVTLQADGDAVVPAGHNHAPYGDIW